MCLVETVSGDHVAKDFRRERVEKLDRNVRKTGKLAGGHMALCLRSDHSRHTGIRFEEVNKENH